jgi:hypothetical protein
VGETTCVSVAVCSNNAASNRCHDRPCKKRHSREIIFGAFCRHMTLLTTQICLGLEMHSALSYATAKASIAKVACDGKVPLLDVDAKVPPS